MYYAIIKTERGLEYWAGGSVEDMCMSKTLRHPDEVNSETTEQIYSAVARWMEEVYTHEMVMAPLWKQHEIRNR